jgi:hypothetical protein
VQRRVRAPTWPNAIRTVVHVLRIHRVPHHRHRAWHDRVRARWLTARALSPVVRLDPDALDGRRLVASTVPTRVQSAPLGIEGLG